MPSTGSCFRLKLEFECPPPAMPGSCKYMIMVKTDICKTIYDLEQTVIRKFGFSKGATTTLALDGFVLVPMEDISILSNNDCILVTVHQETKNAAKTSSSKKRKLHNVNDVAVTRVTKSIRKRSQAPRTSRTPDKISTIKSTIARKKRKTSTSCDSSSPEDERKPQKPQKSTPKLKGVGTAATKKPVIKPMKSVPKIFVKKSATSSNDSSDTSSDDKNATAGKKQNGAAASVVKPIQNRAAASVVKPTVKNAIEPEKTLKEPRKKRAELKCKRHTANSTKNSSANHITFDSSNSHSSGSDLEMETEDPAQNQEQPSSHSLKAWLKSSVNTKEHFQNLSRNFKDPGVSTNVSIVYENPTVEKDEPEKSDKIENNERPPRNYTELLPSTWPPRVGDMIAYKILEMSQDYTPIITGYKEAKVLEIFPSSTSPIGVDGVRMELLWQEKANRREGGRFEMDLGEDETSDSEDLVVEWQSLLEPKRIH